MIPTDKGTMAVTNILHAVITTGIMGGIFYAKDSDRKKHRYIRI